MRPIFAGWGGGQFRYFVLFDHGLFDKICDNIKYLSSKKVVLEIVLVIILERSELIYIILLNKTLAFHNVIILIKSVVNYNKNEYYYNIVLEKGSCKDRSDTRYF